jgi:transposase
MGSTELGKMVFIDECSVNCGMTRLYGRTRTTKRVNEYVSDNRFERTSIVSSIRLNLEQAPMLFKGSLDSAVFSVYIKEVLVPTLKKDDIVILDNLSVHKVFGALSPIYEMGAQVKFLPPYSPDYNPIELVWSKLKTSLRKSKPVTFDELVNKTVAQLYSFSKILNFH